MKEIVLFLSLLVVGVTNTLACEKIIDAVTNKQAVLFVQSQYGQYICDALDEFGLVVSPSYIVGKIVRESAGNRCAVGTAGEKGLTQIKETTATFIRKQYPTHNWDNKNLFDEKTNIRLTVANLWYLADEHNNGITYDTPGELSMGHKYGARGGEKYVAIAYEQSYVRDIFEYAGYVKGTVCSTRTAFAK